MNGFYPTEFENYEQGTKRRSMSNASSSPYAKFRFRSQLESSPKTAPRLSTETFDYVRERAEEFRKSGKPAPKFYMPPQRTGSGYEVPRPSYPQSATPTSAPRERYYGVDGERNPNWSPEQGLPRWLRQRMMETQGRYNEAQRQGRLDPNSQQAMQARQFFESQRQKRMNPNTYMRGGFERKGLVRNPLLLGM